MENLAYLVVLTEFMRAAVKLMLFIYRQTDGQPKERKERYL